MSSTLRRIVLTAVLAAATAQPSGASQVMVSTPPPMVVDASPAHPVLAGGIIATARVRGERAEILAIVRPQATFDANRVVTDALVAHLRAALPGYAVSGEPLSEVALPNGMQVIDRVSAGGMVRVAVPGPLDDAGLRAVVDRARAALNAPPPGMSAAYGEIHDVALGLSSCATLDRAGDADALAAIGSVARALGDRSPGGVTLGDRTARPIYGRPDPLCGPDVHARPFQLQRSLAPTTANGIENRRYAFRRAFPRPLAATLRQEPFVPDTSFAFGPWADARLRITSNAPVLTVAGFAPVHVTYDGARYVWNGPNGRYQMRDLRADVLSAARARLRALGIRDDAIVTQLDPVSGRLYAEVRVPDGPPRDDIIAALAGESANERHEVRFMRYRNSCAPHGDDVRAAVADAAARARAVVHALGTTADLAHPIAIDLLSSSVGQCVTADTPPYDDRVARRVAGSLALASDDATVALTVTFPIAPVAISGDGDAPPPLDSDLVRRLIPPAVDYPAAALSGEARVDTTLPATQLVVQTRFGPDSEHGFRNVAAAVPAAFAARVGSTPATSSTTLAGIPSYANDNAAMDEWRTTMLLDARPGLLDNITAANLEANKNGNVWTDVLPERRSCGDAPLALAVRAIRSAAAAAKGHATQRLVAIDLAGPFTDGGRCSIGAGPYARGADVRHATATVRLAAYARVSYR